MTVQKLRIFISSPGDVGLERDLAGRVIERLRGEFGSRLDFETIRWEDRPVRATDSFQPQIIPPSETDIVVCVLWSRLGTPLPEQFRRPDGSRFGSGTEWEFEDAARAYRETGTPDLLVYRRTQDPPTTLNDPRYEERAAQYQALEEFCRRWFFAEDGAFKAAFKTFEEPQHFESVLESDLHHLCLEKLPAQVADSFDTWRGAVRWHKGSPFRGLATFGLEHAPVFFGRTAAIADIKERLTHRAQIGLPFLLVFGMSGCGKSSLLRAGALATMTRPGVVDGIDFWRWCTFRPSDAPQDLCRGLAGALLSESALPELAGHGVTIDEMTTMLREAPQHAATPLGISLRQAATDNHAGRLDGGPTEARIIMLVDQLEELFTVDGISEQDRVALVDAIAGLVRSGLVWIVATMRSDYYPRCAELPVLVDLKEGDGQYDLRPPTFDEIGQMIQFPSRAAGLRFELNADTGERLDSVLHEAAAKDAHALPLLSFTLDELYRRRNEDEILTFAAYHELGGMEGALARRAESTYLELPQPVQQTLPPLMRGLVTVSRGDDEVFAARRVPLKSLATSAERKSMLDALVEARLLIADRAEDGTAVVRVAHEALLSHWPRVRGWLEEDREFLRVRTRLIEQSEHWQEESEREDLLLPAGRALAEAEEALQQRRDELDRLVIEYIERSIGRRRRQRVRLLAGTAALAAGLTATGFISYNAWRNWREKAAIAAQETDKAREEIKLTREQQEENRREELRLAYDKSWSAARYHMAQALPTLRAKAIDEYAECRQIASELLDTDDQEERISWTLNLADVLLAISNAYSASPDDDGGRLEKVADVLKEREKLLAGLPPEAQSRKDAKKGAEFGGYRSTVIQLQTELFIANFHLRELLRRKAEEDGKPDPWSDESGKEYLEFAVKNLELIELVANSTGTPDDQFYVAKMSSMIGLEYKRYQDLDKATEYFRRAIHEQQKELVRQMQQDLESAYRMAGVEKLLDSGETNRRNEFLTPPRQVFRLMPGKVGLEFKDREDGAPLVVDQLMPGSPAALEGTIQPGDRITGIGRGETGDLVDIAGTGQDELNELFSGPHGSVMRYRVVKPSETDERIVRLTRHAQWVPFDEDTAGTARELYGYDTEFALALIDQEKYGEARAVILNMVDLASHIRPEYRDLSFDRRVFAAQRELARLYHRTGKEQEAWDLLARSVDENTASDKQVVAEATRRTVENHKSAAATFAALKNVDAARTQYEAAVAAQRRAVQVLDASDEQRRLAALLEQFATFLQKHELPRAARDQFRAAAELYGQLYRSEANEAAVKSLVNASLQAHKLAVAAGDAKESGEIKAIVESTLDDWQSQIEPANDHAKTAAAFHSVSDWYTRIDEREKAFYANERSLEFAERSLDVEDDKRSLLVKLYNHAIDAVQLKKPAEAARALAKCRAWGDSTLADPADTHLRVRVLGMSAYVAEQLEETEAAIAFAEQTLKVELPLDDDDFVRKQGSVMLRMIARQTGLLTRLNSTEGIAASYEKRIALARRIVDVVGDQPSQQQLAETHGSKAKWHSGKQEDKQALAEFRAEIDILQRMAADKQPANLDFVARVHVDAGIVLMRMQRYDEAAAEYEANLDLRKQLADQSDQDQDWLMLSLAHNRRAKPAFELGDAAEAASHLRRAIQTLQTRIDRDPASELKKRQASYHLSLSWYLLFDRKPDQAIKAARAGLQLNPDNNNLATNLLHGHLFLGQLEQAKAVLAEYKDQTMYGGTSRFSQVILDDFKALRERNLVHPDMQIIEGLIEQQQ